MGHPTYRLLRSKQSPERYTRGTPPLRLSSEVGPGFFSELATVDMGLATALRTRAWCYAIVPGSLLERFGLHVLAAA